MTAANNPKMVQNPHPVSTPRAGCAARLGEPCDFVSIGNFDDRSGKIGAVEIARCSYCGHGITLPPLSDVAFLYASRESQDFQPSTKGISALIKHAAFRMQARKLLRQLPDQPCSVLDFGCGSGQFTTALAELLTSATVVGSDFHDSAPAALDDCSYQSRMQLDAGAQHYDLVIAMHVLEHDDDTAALLARIVGMARPGGVVVIEVPNVDCIWARIFGKTWDAWYVPYHRTHFTRTSLRHWLKVAGLETCTIYDATVPTMGRTLANVFGHKNNLFWLLCGIALHPVQWLGEKLAREPSALRAVVRI